MQPGGPFSGPCFPRDNQALLNFSKKIKYKNELNKGIIKTNKLTLESIKLQLNTLKDNNFSSIVFCGLGYKSNTPSLEESFILKLISHCRKINLDVYYYDRYVDNVIEDGKRLLDLNELEKHSDIIFLPYVDDNLIK